MTERTKPPFPATPLRESLPWTLDDASITRSPRTALDWVDHRRVTPESDRYPAVYRPQRRTQPNAGPDRIGIVGFHEHGFVIARPAEPYAPWLMERSQSLHERLGGRTNMADGLRQALQLLSTVPHGIHRRIWLLSDGEPNVDVASIGPLLDACYAAHININTIGFGNSFDERLLRHIASATHRGRFLSVQNLRQLTTALAEADNPIPPQGRRSETTILTIDCSGSMSEPMEGRWKIFVVEEAILHLLHYKQRLFS